MASIFTYDPNPPRVSSPWSTPRGATPQPSVDEADAAQQHEAILTARPSSPVYLSETGITRLEAEPQEGSTEYKLHLLLRPRRIFSSTSTSTQVSGSQHSAAYLSKAGVRSNSLSPAYPVQPPSMQSRQTRLQQLTTQLLWRLQQSSPFHSSSMADPIIPSLPETTTKLGISSTPATLLPGLEESQGALYEIGVSDDGTFVGLAQDELEESLANLKTMATSLGCVVQVLRKVIVGHCEWSDTKQAVDSSTAQNHVDNLWVAEALVRPDLETCTQTPGPVFTSDPAQFRTVETVHGLETSEPEISRSDVVQLRVSLIGATNSGKSSLLGTLTTSTLDNGRGKSRLNLLKHPHEIASGVTSSVAQELIGYHKRGARNLPARTKGSPVVINYASENVSSWNDIHASAERLVFLSDSPGLPRYSKSTIRTLVSWKPHWTIACIAADSGASDVDGNTHVLTGPTAAGWTNTVASATNLDSLFMHIELCLKLGLPLIVAMTKMDIATKVNLRQTLGKLLSALKVAGKKPMMMSTLEGQSQCASNQSMDLQCVSIADEVEVQRVTKLIDETGIEVVPIVLTSAVTAQGIGKLHGLLRSMPILEESAQGIAAAPLSSLEQNHDNDVSSKIFQVDEVFAMPPSKVYNASRAVQEAGQGTVLCGFVLSNSIHIGESLKLGPFLVETIHESTQQDTSLHRSISFPSSTINGRPPSHLYSKSIPAPGPSLMNKAKESTVAALWHDVRVVSLRNLRLPTRSLSAGQIGTIGVEPISSVAPSGCDLRRARKGMILASFEGGEPSAYRSFSASFPASDFWAANSPPLILGGHATIYANSTRSPVKVTSVALTEHDDDKEPSSRDDSGVFTFDGDDQNAKESKEIKIKFRFLSSLEWMRLGDRVLVVPNAASVGPVTGGFVPATGGLSGFVGRVCGLSG
ncbi:hypothetical protein GJ744_009972 [Endocarpon pusillum]|uniref:Tr-type G domain-containing protein n=1 Tax=Endocarpon pusillum TaxID=364733 RepID=A0A8H7AFD8_9EURO|nr:hypothetical protein GJ744_009972 [Endocarpon pusillum]